MPKNKIDDLRNLMMETIERLLDPEDPMDAKKAVAISQLGNVVVNSAKAELQAAKYFNSKTSGFFQVDQSAELKQISAGTPVETDIDAEMPDCRCGELIYPADLDQSTNLGLEYPRCAACLLLLPKNSKDLNGGGK